MQEIVKIIGRMLSSLAYIGLLLSLFIFMFAVLGMHLFGGEFDFGTGCPDANLTGGEADSGALEALEACISSNTFESERHHQYTFDTFWESLLSVFTIITLAYRYVAPPSNITNSPSMSIPLYADGPLQTSTTFGCSFLVLSGA